MTHEYICYFSLPDDSQIGGSFYLYMNDYILQPLQRAGYYVINHYLGSVWDLEAGDIRLSLEYLDNDGGFCLTVDRSENADEVIADFLKHTPLQLWSEN